MTRYLLTLIFLKIAFVAASQPPSPADTVCITVGQAQQMLRTKDSLQIMKVEKDSLAALAALRSRYIDRQQGTIDSLNAAATASGAAIAATQKSRDLALQEADIQAKNAKAYQHSYIQQKRRKVWVIIGAVVAEAATIYFMAK